MFCRVLFFAALFAALNINFGFAQDGRDTLKIEEELSVLETTGLLPPPIASTKHPKSESTEGGCPTDMVILNSGYDHFNGAAYPTNVPDARWTVLYDQDTNTTEPRPASTINPNAAWEPAEPNSQWIGTYPGNAQTTNGDYVFDTVFCVSEQAEFVLISIGMRADDECRVYLNESLPDILSNAATPFYVGQDFNDPELEIHTFKMSNVAVGKNHLTVKVTNTGNVAMGLNVVASVTAFPGGTAERPECCCATGVIQGLKYNDLNGNGMRDLGEPVLPGWTFNLVGANYSATATTDNAGFFNFVNVPADNYTLTEVQQPGWVQTEPAVGGYNFTLNPLQSIGGLEFGNREAACEFESDNILCELDEQGNPTGDYIVTGTFTNEQSIPGTHLLLPPNAISPAGVQLCFGNGAQVLPLNPPVQSGDSFEVGANPSNDDAIIIKNAMPGDEVCFRLILLGENGEECCSVEVCFVMPPCDCFQIDRRRDRITEVHCNSDGTVDFSYSFELTNLMGVDAYHAFLASGGIATLTPDYFDLFVANGNAPFSQGQSVMLKTYVTGAFPDVPLNILITLHTEDFADCCSRMHRIIAPSCDSDPTGDGDGGGGQLTDNMPGDMNNDGLVNVADIQPFVELLTTGEYNSNGDVNQDGKCDLLDINAFVELLTGV